MDRLKELDKIAEKLDGETIYKKSIWLIMDHTHKVLLKGGVDKYLCLVDDVKDRKRLFHYNTEGSAKRAMYSSWFALENGVKDYLDKKYGSDTNIKNTLEVVKAVSLVKI